MTDPQEPSAEALAFIDGLSLCPSAAEIRPWALALDAFAALKVAEFKTEWPGSGYARGLADGRAEERAKPPQCEHHYIGGNDGMWCTKCGDEQPLLERQRAKPTASDEERAKAWMIGNIACDDHTECRFPACSCAKNWLPILTKYGAEVRREEREACAKMCDDIARDMQSEATDMRVERRGEMAATFIDARGKQSTFDRHRHPFPQFIRRYGKMTRDEAECLEQTPNRRDRVFAASMQFGRFSFNGKQWFVKYYPEKKWKLAKLEEVPDEIFHSGHTLLPR